jgi:hypothetical protein
LSISCSVFIASFADGGDVGVVEAVGGADGKLDLVHRHVEELAEAVLLLADLGAAALELDVVGGDGVEDLEVVAQDGGRIA